FSARVPSPATARPAKAPLSFTAFLAEEKLRRADLEYFANTFWSLEPGERQRRWRDLVSRCAFSPFLMARLEYLEPALEQERIQADQNDLPTNFAQQVQDLQILRPTARAREKQFWIKARRKNIDIWEMSAQTAQKRFPPVA